MNKGEIVVKGETYGTSAAVNMAAVPTDREIAAYVRQAWGKKQAKFLRMRYHQFK